MKVNKLKKGQTVRIYNPSNIFIRVKLSNATLTNRYDGAWVRGIVDRDGNIDPYSTPTDKKNYIVVEFEGVINSFNSTDDWVTDNPTVYKFKVVNSNSYIATHSQYECARSIVNGMEIFTYPNIEVEMDDANEKEKQEFVLRMFPLLSAKYPKMSDANVLKKARKLSDEMYNN